MKRIAIALLVISFVLCGVVYTMGYHGIRSFGSQLTVLPDPGIVVKNARSLSGSPYDPLMGKQGNIGAAVGFIVCSDVPNIAYGLAGFSLQAMLEEDFKVHQAGYDTANGNEPGNPYFHRRARNLFAYFQANNRLLPPDVLPMVGDLAFYRHDPNSYISHVALVTAVEGSNFWIMESAPETLVAKEVIGTSPISRGWLPVGFGRMYQSRRGGD